MTDRRTDNAFVVIAVADRDGTANSGIAASGRTHYTTMSGVAVVSRSAQMDQTGRGQCGRSLMDTEVSRDSTTDERLGND